MEPVVRWQCVASGRVQGVNYRVRVAEAARRRGISGTVQNRSDGTVVIVAQGPRGVLEVFLADVRGPRGFSDAREVVRVAELPAVPTLVSFDILR
jgi:acylphosphatase